MRKGCASTANARCVAKLATCAAPSASRCTTAGGSVSGSIGRRTSRSVRDVNANGRIEVQVEVEFNKEFNKDDVISTTHFFRVPV